MVEVANSGQNRSPLARLVAGFRDWPKSTPHSGQGGGAGDSRSYLISDALTPMCLHMGEPRIARQWYRPAGDEGAGVAAISGNDRRRFVHT